MTKWINGRNALTGLTLCEVLRVIMMFRIVKDRLSFCFLVSLTLSRFPVSHSLSRFLVSHSLSHSHSHSLSRFLVSHTLSRLAGARQAFGPLHLCCDSGSVFWPETQNRSPNTLHLSLACGCKDRVFLHRLQIFPCRLPPLYA